jgi:hypothetical protein
MHAPAHNLYLLIETQHGVVLNRHGQGILARSLKYLLIHSHPSHPLILHLPILSFLAQSQIKELINFLRSIQSIEPPS